MKKKGLLKLSLLLVLAVAFIIVLAGCTNIVSMEIQRNDFAEVFERYGYYDVTKLTLLVKFDNGKEIEVEVTKDMVTGMSTDTVGDFELTVEKWSHKATLPYKVVRSLTPALVFDSNGGSYVPAILTNYGEAVKSTPADPAKEGYTFLGWFTEKDGGVEFDFNTKLYEDTTVYAHWEINFYTVEFMVNGEHYTETSAMYGTKITAPADPAAPVDYEFVGWYLNGNKFDFNSVITSDIVLEAKFELVLEKYIEVTLSLLNANKADNNFYREQDHVVLDTLYNEAVAGIENAETREEAKAAYDAYFMGLKEYKTYMDLLDEVFAGYKASDYSESVYEQMKQVVSTAKELMKSYKDLEEALPVDIYESAVVALAEFPTYDAERAEVEALKAEILAALKEMVEPENEVRYDAENWQALNDIVDEVEKDFAEGIDTEAELNEYYFELLLKLMEIEAYEAGDQLVEVNNAYNAFLENEYWDEDKAALTEIYEEAMTALREYEGGAPMPQMIAKQAIEAMEKVLTKAEDIEAGDAAKAGKIRELNAYYATFDEEYYSEENWAALVGYYTNGIEAINAAEGTRAVAKAYAEAVEAMANVARLTSGSAIDRLIAKYNELAANEYFEEDWAEIEKIYDAALEAIRSYVAGAPTPETIADQAIEAMEKVMTKAEDIEAGNAAKDGKIRELRAFYEALVEYHYTEKNWAAVTNMYTTGIQGIRLAEGTRAVARAYASTIEVINEIPELEHKALVDEVIEALASYDEEDYFAEDYEEIVKIANEAIEALRAYVGGAPSPETIAAQAIEAMSKVMTKEEDIEAANSAKDAKIRDLKVVYEGYVEAYYSEENWNTLTNIYTTGIEGIRAAVGTRAVAQAYANAVELMKEIPELAHVEYVKELVEAFLAYDEEDYFEEDYNEIVKIAEEAVVALREYEGGAPSPSMIVKQAKDAMEKVLTMEEDIAVAEAQKEAKLRELRTAYESYNELYYSEENAVELSMCYKQGVYDIEAAEGTRAVAQAYANAINAMKAVPELEYASSIRELEAAIASYKEEDYFAEDYEEIVKIGEQAMEQLREYEGGAPIPEMIVKQAIAAMEKVLTKAEDIEAANSQKAAKVRELRTVYETLELKKADYSDDNWNKITSIYNSGVEAINDAEGTRAVAQAYADAVKAMNDVPVVETLAQIAALKEYYEAIDKNDYFAAQQEELVVALNKGIEMLRAYNETSEKTPDELLADAKALLDAVNNKEKDSAIADSQRSSYKDKLQAYVDALNESDYAPEVWSVVKSLLEQGKANIEAAEGTAALKSAYEAAIAAIEKAIK